MTTDVIGQLPCPECNTVTELKSDGRKHTLKCPECGMLAYYQTQRAKQQIEQRLKDKSESALHTPKHTLALQLPKHSDAQQRFILSVEPFGIEPVSGEMATVDTDLEAANEDKGNTQGKKEEARELFDWIGEHL